MNRARDPPCTTLSVILVENFSGQKISARSRRDRVNLAEVGEISARFLEGEKLQRDLAEIAVASSISARFEARFLEGTETGEISPRQVRSRRENQDLAETTTISTRHRDLRQIQDHETKTCELFSGKN